MKQYNTFLFNGSLKNCRGGHGKESRTYNNGPCVICSWNSWGAWSAGSKTCGSEFRTRRRLCKCEDGSSGTWRCAGGFGSEAKVDHKGPCTIYNTPTPHTVPAPYQIESDAQHKDIADYKPKPYYAKGNVQE